MRHEFRWPAFACAVALCALLAACASVGALVADSAVFTAPQLQVQLDRRFPRDYDKLGGLVTLTVLNPRLSIPEAGGRIRLDFDVGLGGTGNGRTPAGHMAVSSGLRFDAARRGLFLDAPQLESADFPRLGGVMNATGREFANRWLADYARDEPVYELDATLAQRIAARRISGIDIGNQQVVIRLGN